MSIPRIHPTAIIDPKAQIASDVQIGAYTIIDEKVIIGEGTSIASHCVIKKGTSIGKHNKIYQFSSLGEIPQDKKYQGEETQLIIGDHNTIREFCSFNIGTSLGKNITIIGNHNWIMANSHVAHDCALGDHIVLSNGGTLGGHVTIDSYAILGGYTLVHQFCKIGAHVMIGGGSGVIQDVPPYVMVFGHPAKPKGINLEGLNRCGFSPQIIHQIKIAYKTLYRKGHSLEDAIQMLSEQSERYEEIAIFVKFLQQTTRGIIR